MGALDHVGAVADQSFALLVHGLNFSLEFKGGSSFTFPATSTTSQAAITAVQRSELQDLYARVCAQQRVSLPRLHNFLIRLEGQLK